MSLQLPAIPITTHPMHSFSCAHCLAASRGRRSCLALHGSASGSGLRFSYASSPMHQAVSCSTLFYLWTGSSSPVASYPVSRRRSHLRLRTASVLSDGDFHPTVGAHSQAHVGPSFASAWEVECRTPRRVPRTRPSASLPRSKANPHATCHSVPPSCFPALPARADAAGRALWKRTCRSQYFMDTFADFLLRLSPNRVCGTFSVDDFMTNRSCHFSRLATGSLWARHARQGIQRESLCCF